MQHKKITIILHKQDSSFSAGINIIYEKRSSFKKGIDKAVSTLKQFTPILENVSLNAVYVFATASLRNIRNSEYALKTISRHSGFDIQLISGETEGIRLLGRKPAGICKGNS